AANNEASDLWSRCFDSAYTRLYDKDRSQFEIEADRCRQNRESHELSVSKLVRLMLGQEKDAWAWWLVLLVPLTLFWIVSAIIIATLRWIRRGFTTAETKS